MREGCTRGAFDRAPLIVIWETTRACALACVHCRAAAIPHRDAGELTTDEARRLIDRVAAFGTPPPLLVLTGGDPLRRPDIAQLVAHGTARGLSVSLTPSGTAAVTEDRLRTLRDAGLARLAVSLDGDTEAVHDAFRGVRASYGHTMKIIDRARRLGLPLQINTTVCRRTLGELPALAARMSGFGAVLWVLFFLIPVGRAHASQALSADEIESILEWAADLAPSVPFGIKTTEAPHYHRVLAARDAIVMRRRHRTVGARISSDERAAPSPTATASCSSITRGTSVPAAFCRCPSATCGAMTSCASTGTTRPSRRCERPRRSAAAAVCASTAIAAGAAGRAPSRPAAIRSARTRAASGRRRLGHPRHDIDALGSWTASSLPERMTARTHPRRSP